MVIRLSLKYTIIIIDTIKLSVCCINVRGIGSKSKQVNTVAKIQAYCDIPGYIGVKRDASLCPRCGFQRGDQALTRRYSLCQPQPLPSCHFQDAIWTLPINISDTFSLQTSTRVEKLLRLFT